MTDDPDRRDDPRWDARAAEWVRIEPGRAMTDDEIERIRARLAECDEGAPCTITQDYELDYDPDEDLDTEVRCAVADIRALLAALDEARAERDRLVRAIVHDADARRLADEMRAAGAGGYAPHDGDCEMRNGTCLRCGRHATGADFLAAVDRAREAGSFDLRGALEAMEDDDCDCAAERDRARREAIEACIALCDREIAFAAEAAQRCNGTQRARRWAAGGIGAERVRERLRDLLTDPDTRT